MTPPLYSRWRFLATQVRHMKPMRSRSFRLRESDIQLVSYAAGKENLTVSEFVRRAIRTAAAERVTLEARLPASIRSK